MVGKTKSLLYLSHLIIANILICNSLASDGRTDAVKRGERLFHGLIPREGKAVNCASCHNTHAIDTFNWNPDAYSLALMTDTFDSAAFANAILGPGSKVKMLTHGQITLTPGDIAEVQAYLKYLAWQGMPEHKPLITQKIIFGLLILLLILSVVDLVVTHRIKWKAIPIAIINVCVLGIIMMVAHEAIKLGRSEGYMPTQPIKFSHEIHSGANQIACIYCHSGTESSKVAAIPPANVCMNCHMVVREGSHSGRFEINKLIKAYETGQPIEWIKVHNLPDHVFFSHAQHVGVGKLSCQECHGPVETMTEVTQMSDLSMGWCVNCHRETKVQFFDNAFYEAYEDIHQKVARGELDTASVADVGGLDCMKCHY